MQTGFLDRTITKNGTAYAYQVYVPRNYTPDQAWPAVLFLHGAGERGTDGLLQTEVGIAPAIRRFPGRFPAIIVMPQAPEDSRWSEAPGAAALAALDRTTDEFVIDPKRIYLTGLSMGGHGSWYLAYHHTERFAALLVICGFVGDRPNRPTFVPAGNGTPYQRMAARLTRLPTWIVHGEADSLVPVAESRSMAEALQVAGGDVHYTELPGTDHDSWTATYASASIVEWLFAQRRR